MNNNVNKMIQPISPSYLEPTKRNSEAFFTPTPMMVQQTPQMMPQMYYNNYNNYTSPTIPESNSPSTMNRSNLDLIHQPSNLQIYNQNLNSLSPNYAMRKLQR